FRKTLAIEPALVTARMFVACSYVEAGRSAEGLAQPEDVDGAKREYLAIRAWVLSNSGDNASAARVVRDLASRAQKERTHPAVLAALHGLLGEKDRAFALLDRAIVERDPMVRDLRVSPMWDSLRTDARFAKALKRVNLE